MATLDEIMAALDEAETPANATPEDWLAALDAVESTSSPEQVAASHDSAYSRIAMGPNADTPNMAGTARSDNTFDGMQEFAARAGGNVLDMGRVRAEARAQGGYVPNVPASQQTQDQIAAMRDRVGRAGDAPIQEAVRFGEGMVNTEAGPVDAVALARRLRDESPALAASVAGMQGLPFVGSYSDELIGQIGGVIGTNDPAVITEVARQIDRTYSEDMPVTSNLIKIAGGLGAGRAMALTATPAVAATAPASPLGRAVYGAAAGSAAGAAEGAVYGYGAGDEGDRMASAGQGARVGGIFGGALGAAVPMAGSAIRSVRDFFKGTPVREAAQALGVSEQVIEDLRRAISANDAAGRSTIGAGGMLADAGPATSGMLDASVRGSAMGSPLAMSRVSERATAEGAAVTTVLDDVLGAPQGQIAAGRAIRDELAPEVRQAYEAANAAIIDTAAPEGQAVIGVLNRMPERVVDQAVARANEILRWEGASVSPMQITRNAQGQIEVVGDLGVAHLDMLKRALDEVRNDGTDILTGRVTADARLAGEMAAEIRTATRSASPEYDAALNLAAPMQAQRAAVDTGYQVMPDTVQLDQAAEQFRNMTPPERQAAAQGVRNYIDHTLSRVRATAGETDVDVRQVQRAVTALSSDLTRGKLRLLVGEAESDRIMTALDRAGVAINLRAQTVAGSRSAGRTAFTQSVEGRSNAGFMNRLGRLQVVGAAEELIGAMTGRDAASNMARNEGLYAEMADILTRSDGDEAMRALNLLREVNVFEPISRERATIIANQVAAVLAAEAERQANQEFR